MARNRLFVKKLCLIDCARSAESVGVWCVSPGNYRQMLVSGVLTALPELGSSSQKTTETSFNGEPHKYECAVLTTFRELGKRIFLEKFLPESPRTFWLNTASLSWSWATTRRQENELPGLEINCSILIISDDWLVVKRMCSSSDCTGSESWENKNAFNILLTIESRRFVLN